MQPPQISLPGEVLKSIQILFYSMVLGVALFAIVINVIHFIIPAPLQNKSFESDLFIGICLFDVICLTIARNLFIKKIAVASRPGMILVQKLKSYKTALIIYLVICEVPALITLVIFFLTGNKRFLVLAVIIWLGMLLKYPKKIKIINELQLNSTEQMGLN
jgi:hypothetical protein